MATSARRWEASEEVPTPYRVVSLDDDAEVSSRPAHFDRVRTNTLRAAALLSCVALVALGVAGRRSPSATAVLRHSDAAVTEAWAPVQAPIPWCARDDRRPVPKLWSYNKSAPAMKVKVLTYNLFWWNLYGQRAGNGESASHLIAKFSDPQFDLMGFQECEDPERVLIQAGLQGLYQIFRGRHSTCLAFRIASWRLLDQGQQEVAEDMKAQYFGRRTAQWARLRRILPGGKEGGTMLFVNHHGPLPINTGGKCGGISTAHNLLRLIGEKGEPGDAIVLVGDFNANGASLTVMELERHLYRIFSGVVEDGIDNFFSNLGGDHLLSGVRMGPGGSDHDALHVVVEAANGGPKMPPLEPRWLNSSDGTAEHDVDFAIDNLMHIKTVGDDTYVAAASDGKVAAVAKRSHEQDGFKETMHDDGTFSYRSLHGTFLAAMPGKEVVSAVYDEGHWSRFHKTWDTRGTASLRTPDRRYIKMAPNGTLQVKNFPNGELGAGRFRFEASQWLLQYDHTPSSNMCGALCKKTHLCKAWTWSDAGLPGPWPGRCVLKGGGFVSKEKKDGFVSGFASKEASEENYAGKAALHVQMVADKDRFFATTSTMTTSTVTTSTVTSSTSTVTTCRDCTETSTTTAEARQAQEEDPGSDHAMRTNLLHRNADAPRSDRGSSWWKVW